MTIQVIHLTAPLSSSKGEIFLRLQDQEIFREWSFLSTNPLRRAQMKDRGATDVVNPFKYSSRNFKGCVWLDEWQSFLSTRFEELLFELFSDQGVEIVILSQSFSLKNERRLLRPWLLNTNLAYTYHRACPNYLLSSSKSLIRGIQSFAHESDCLKSPYEVPPSLAREVLIPYCIHDHSHLLSLARNYHILVFKGPNHFYLADILLWLLGGHQRASLIGSQGENKNRRNINKESTLSRSSFDRRVSFKKWQKGISSLLWWTRWRQENEAFNFRAWKNVHN